MNQAAAPLEDKPFTSRAADLVKLNTLQSELTLILFKLRLHLRHKPDEFGRLSDAAQVSIALEQRVVWKSGRGRLS